MEKDWGRGEAEREDGGQSGALPPGSGAAAGPGPGPEGPAQLPESRGSSGGHAGRGGPFGGSRTLGRATATGWIGAAGLNAGSPGREAGEKGQCGGQGHREAGEV